MIFTDFGFRHLFQFIIGGFFCQPLRFCLFRSPQHSWGIKIIIQIGIGAEGDVFQILTALERAVSDFGHRVGNGDATEVGTLIKRRVADRGDVSGKNDPGDRPFEVRPRIFFHLSGWELKREGKGCKM